MNFKMVNIAETKYIASSTRFKKYKHYETFKGKVIIIDGSQINSIVLEDERKTKEEAVEDANIKIKEIEEKGLVHEN